MSKLADAIRRSQRIDAAPMGFGAAKPAPRPTMLTGAVAKAGEDLQAYAQAGIDLLLVDARGSSAPEARGHSAALLGLIAGPVDAATVAQLKQAGYDFVVCEASTTAAAALLDDDIAYVLSVSDTAEEAFLRSLEPLALDAVYLESVPQPLTLAGQIALTRVSLLSRKPLVCLTPDGISADDLRCLRAAGCVAVLASGAAAAKTLKETVAALPPRKTRRDEGRAVALPAGAATSADDDEDDD